MEVVVLETVHESGETFRLCRLYNDNGDESGFAVYRGRYDGEEGHWRVLGKWSRIDSAVDHYIDVLRRMMSQKVGSSSDG